LVHRTLKMVTVSSPETLATVYRNMQWYSQKLPITVAVRLNTGIVCSNPTRDMNVCRRFFCDFAVLYVGRGLATDWSPSKEYSRLCIKVKSLYLTNYALRCEGVSGSGCIDPYFFDLSIRWRWVVSFTPRSLYPRGKNPDTYCIGGWAGPRAGLNDMEKWKFLTLPGLELRPLGRPASSQSLYWHRLCIGYETQDRGRATDGWITFPEARTTFIMTAVRTSQPTWIIFLDLSV
jgi:hypothetical protein